MVPHARVGEHGLQVETVSRIERGLELVHLRFRRLETWSEGEFERRELFLSRTSMTSNDLAITGDPWYALARLMSIAHS